MDSFDAIGMVTKVIWSMRLKILDLIHDIKLSNNPQKIRAEVDNIFENKTSRFRKSLENQDSGNSSKSFDQSSDHAELKKVGLFLWFSADRYWNKPGNRNGYRAAWYYAKSGEAFELAGDFGSAGRLYHFAGHQFRKFDSQRKAMDLYLKSALTIRRYLDPSHPTIEIANRSIRRAIGIAKNIGDEKILCDKMIENNIYKELTDQFESNNQNVWA